MEAADNILDAIDEEVSLGDGEDVDMMDVEEGEVVEGPISGRAIEENASEVKAEPCKDNPQRAMNMNTNKKRKKKKKKKNKTNAAVPASNAINIDRFVLDVCKRLRERKSYLVYTAVGVLGVSALSDLVKEVDAVQACGGQKTVDGYRFRTGGGILWNILKARDPNAFKEIMKKGKDFEKQFRRPSVQAPTKNNDAPQSGTDAITRNNSASVSDDYFEMENPGEDQAVLPNLRENQAVLDSTEDKRRPVRDRLRVPVSYDDLVGEELPKDQPT